MSFKFNNNFNKKPKRILILGSSGIVSSNLQKFLKKKKINFHSIGKSKLDLRKENSFKILSKKIKRNDVVVFIAAEAPVKNIDMFINNIKICRTVCASLKQKKIKQLIYISSDAIYADVKGKISEKSKILPSSLHGLMHLVRETILIDKFDKILCIIRPTLIYGIGDSHFGYGPNRFINLALKNKLIKIFGNGEEKRDHFFIDDLIKIIIKCIEKKAFGILNLASGKICSFKNLAQIVINLSNSKSKLLKIKRIGPMPHNGYRPFNISLLKHYFKDIRITSVKVGIKKYLKDMSK